MESNFSAGDSSNTVIDGGGVSVVIYSNTQNLIDIHIDGFKIMNGANFGSNATGVWSTNSTIRMFNSSIRNCENGAYTRKFEILLIENSNISSNTKFGLSCQDLGSLDISNSVIKNNLGSGIYITRLDTVKIENSEIGNNIVEPIVGQPQGGGITILNTGSFNIVNTTLSNNSGPKAGGIWLYGTNFQIDECIFQNNSGTWPNSSAADAGGANLEPGNDTGTSLITNTTFTNN